MWWYHRSLSPTGPLPKKRKKEIAREPLVVRVRCSRRFRNDAGHNDVIRLRSQKRAETRDRAHACARALLACASLLACVA